MFLWVNLSIKQSLFIYYIELNMFSTIVKVSPYLSQQFLEVFPGLKS